MQVSLTPDGRSMLVVADFGLFATVWSLYDNVSTFIECPKAAPHDGAGPPRKHLYAFSPDGLLLALVTRKASKVRAVRGMVGSQALLLLPLLLLLAAAPPLGSSAHTHFGVAAPPPPPPSQTRPHCVLS